jgi:hypothetical protein
MTHRHYAYIFALVMITLVLGACAGFDLGDIVRVKTPNAIQQTKGLASTITLNEAEAEYRAWFEETQRTGSQWKANIERASEIRGIFSQLTLSTLDQVGPTVAGIPMLGPALPAMTGLVGLFLGTGRLRKEKEASFNKGMKEGRNGAAPTGMIAT